MSVLQLQPRMSTEHHCTQEREDLTGKLSIRVSHDDEDASGTIIEKNQSSDSVSAFDVHHDITTTITKNEEHGDVHGLEPIGVFTSNSNRHQSIDIGQSKASTTNHRAHEDTFLAMRPPYYYSPPIAQHPHPHPHPHPGVPHQVPHQVPHPGVPHPHPFQVQQHQAWPGMTSTVPFGMESQRFDYPFQHSGHRHHHWPSPNNATPIFHKNGTTNSGDFDDFGPTNLHDRPQGQGEFSTHRNHQHPYSHPYSFFMGGTLNEHGKREGPGPSFYENHSGTDELQLRVQEAPSSAKKKKKRCKIADHEPRRPLSAYNFYFSEERELVIALLSAPAGEAAAEAEAAGEENDGKENNPGGSNDAASDGASSTATLTSTDTATADAISKPDEAALPQDERDSATQQLQQLLSTRKIPYDEMEELQKKININTQRILDTHIEGDRVKKSHKRMHGKIAFQKLARIIGQRWRNISDAEKKQYYFALAKTDLERYNKQMEEIRSSQ